MSETTYFAPESKKPAMSLRRKVAYWALGIFVVFLILGQCSNNNDTITATTVTVTQTPLPSTVTVTVTASPPAAKAPVAAAKTQAPTASAAVIEEGGWEVGTDVPPGIYRTEEVLKDSDCYYEIQKVAARGGDFDNIVTNDNFRSGRPKITLKKGQGFTSHDCGRWVRVG